MLLNRDEHFSKQILHSAVIASPEQLEFFGERGTILFASTKHIHGTTFSSGSD